MEAESSVVEQNIIKESTEEDSSADSCNVSAPSSYKSSDFDSSNDKVKPCGSGSDTNLPGTAKTDPQEKEKALFTNSLSVDFYPVSLKKYPAAVTDKDESALQNWFVVSLKVLFATNDAVEVELGECSRSDEQVMSDIEFSDPIRVPLIDFIKVCRPANVQGNWYIIPLSLFKPAEEVKTPVIIVTTDDNVSKCFENIPDPKPSGADSQQLATSQDSKISQYEPYSVLFYPVKLPFMPPGVDPRRSRELFWYVTSLDGLFGVVKKEMASDPAEGPCLSYGDAIQVAFCDPPFTEETTQDVRALLTNWKAVQMMPLRRFLKPDDAGVVPEGQSGPDGEGPRHFSIFQKPSSPAGGLQPEAVPGTSATTPLGGGQQGVKRSSDGESPSGNSPKLTRALGPASPPGSVQAVVRDYSHRHHSAVADIGARGRRMRDLLTLKAGTFLYPARELHAELLKRVFQGDGEGSPLLDACRIRLATTLEEFNMYFQKDIRPPFQDMVLAGTVGSRLLVETAGCAVSLLEPDSHAVVQSDDNAAAPAARVLAPSSRLLEHCKAFRQSCKDSRDLFQVKALRLQAAVKDTILQSSPTLNPLVEDRVPVQQLQLLVLSLNQKLIEVKESMDDLRDFVTYYADAYNTCSEAILVELNVLSAAEKE